MYTITTKKSADFDNPLKIRRAVTLETNFYFFILFQKFAYPRQTNTEYIGQQCRQTPKCSSVHRLTTSVKTKIPKRFLVPNKAPNIIRKMGKKMIYKEVNLLNLVNLISKFKSRRISIKEIMRDGFRKQYKT